jgi:hypothetical protein
MDKFPGIDGKLNYKWFSVQKSNANDSKFLQTAYLQVGSVWRQAGKCIHSRVSIASSRSLSLQNSCKGVLERIRVTANY